MDLIDRRRVLAGGAALSLTAAKARAGDKTLTTADFVADFEHMWHRLDRKYPYFAEKTTDWALVRKVYGERMTHAASLDDFRRIAQGAITELYDAHSHVYRTPAGTPLYPPYDIYGTAEGEGARVHEVLRQSDAEHAGIRAGDLIIAMNGVPILEVAKARSAICLTRPDAAQDLYALNAALSGVHGTQRLIRLRDAAGAEREVAIAPFDHPPTDDLSFAMLDGNIGYIAITSFSNNDTLVARFDAALAALKDTRGLILDVRDNGGGDTAMAVPMMGRFITEPRAYAHMRRRTWLGRGLGPKWVETVTPRGPFTYAAPVVVLTNRWSASMAEGFPMGMKGIGRATLVGTPMMGLGAGVYDEELPRTGAGYQFSAEPVYDIHDIPRSNLLPDVLAADGEDIQALGIKVLNDRIANQDLT